MERLRLLAADLVVFDRYRLGWRLATRTLLAFLLPLLAAKFLGAPALVYMALGGFLVAIGDSIDDGDRQQFLRIAAGCLAGGLAVACGVMAASHLLLALAGMLLWGLFSGLLGLYGAAFAVMGLPIAWAYVEVGLPADRHDIRFAALAGALWMAGGGLTAALTRLVKFGRANETLGQRCAECYRALARYFESLHHQTDSAVVVSPETQLRAAIAEARRIAESSRLPADDRTQRELALIAIADRLFSQAALLQGQRAAPDPGLADSLDSLAGVSREVASVLSGSAPAASVHVPVDRSKPLEAARDLAAALRIATGAATPPPELSEFATPHRPGPAAGSRALRDGFNRHSVISRHALRFALVMCAAVGVFWVFPPPFGYWVPLTVSVVLKPYAGVTVSRTVQRLIGTAAGVLIATALLPLLPGDGLKLGAVAAAFFCMMLVLPFNYSLAIFFLSLGVVPFEHLLMPALTLDVGLWRLGATAIGAALALIGGHLLWPDFERRELPALLQHSLRSAAAYAAAALGGTALAATRRTAGIDTTTFHMTAQRALSEVGLSSRDRDTIAVAAASLQQLMLAINALPHDSRHADATAEAEKLLTNLASGEADAHTVAAALHRLSLDRIGMEIDVLGRCEESWR